MTPTDNKSALSLLVDDTFTVKLKRSDGKEVPIELRELPAHLLFDVINVVIQHAGAGAMEATPEISAKMASLISFAENVRTSGKGDDAKRAQAAQRAANIASVIGSALPIALRVLPQVPDLVERFLLAVIIDATPQLVNIIKAKDALKIIDAVMQRIDAAEFSESISSFFDQAMALWKSASKQRASIPSTKTTKTHSRKSAVADQA